MASTFPIQWAAVTIVPSELTSEARKLEIGPGTIPSGSQIKLGICVMPLYISLVPPIPAAKTVLPLDAAADCPPLPEALAVCETGPPLPNCKNTETDPTDLK